MLKKELLKKVDKSLLYEYIEHFEMFLLSLNNLLQDFQEIELFDRNKENLINILSMLSKSSQYLKLNDITNFCLETIQQIENIKITNINIIINDLSIIIKQLEVWKNNIDNNDAKLDIIEYNFKALKK